MLDGLQLHADEKKEILLMQAQALAAQNATK